MEEEEGDEPDRVDDEDINEDEDENDDEKDKNIIIAGSSAGGAYGAALGEQGWKKKQENSSARRRNSDLNVSAQSMNGPLMGRPKPGSAKEITDMKHYEWSSWDIVGVVFCIVAVVGCVFITVVLSYQNVQGGVGLETVTSAFLTWLQDIVLRVITITWFEAVMTAPFIFVFCPCCILCSPCSEKSARVHLKLTYEFDVDEGIFKLGDNNTVVKLYPQAQKVGVRLGWRVLKINDVCVATKLDSLAQLKKVNRIQKHFFVTFDVRDETSGAQRERKDQMQRENERKRKASVVSLAHKNL